jgi:hypothetical protein
MIIGTVAVQPKHLPRVFTISLLLFMSAKAYGADPSANPTTADELKQLNDPTLLVTHVSLESEWDQFKDGGKRLNWTFTGLWGWRVSDCQDWAVRLTLPFVYDETIDGSDHHRTGGLGDVEFGTGTAFRLSDKWRMAGGIELHADTASNPSFAEDVWRLKLGWGFAHDFSHWLSLSPNCEYNRSIAEQGNVKPQSYLDMSVPATLILPQHWSVSAKYRTLLDFNNGDRWAQSLTAGIAKRLSHVPVVLSTTFQQPLNSGTKRFQVGVTVVYYF